ncbi:hypothetical protein GCM10009821_09900 [Aeromicrobium halocynthiae]|uniref:Uncharacterized protein n=1 Tax=Aeromicrobium halocynthiae TaxID=560557 RepID=A0ABN2VV57_9ACTN
MARSSRPPLLGPELSAQLAVGGVDRGGELVGTFTVGERPCRGGAGRHRHPETAGAGLEIDLVEPLDLGVVGADGIGEGRRDSRGEQARAGEAGCAPARHPAGLNGGCREHAVDASRRDAGVGVDALAHGVEGGVLAPELGGTAVGLAGVPGVERQGERRRVADGAGGHGRPPGAIRSGAAGTVGAPEHVWTAHPSQ